MNFDAEAVLDHGMDVLLLVGVPLVHLAKKPRPGRGLILVQEEGLVWKVVGHGQYGLPRIQTLDLLLHLLALSNRQRHPARLEFPARRLLELLGWGRGGNRYDQLARELERLTGSLITKCVPGRTLDGFHLIDRFHVVEGHRDSSWIEFGQELHREFAAGRTRPFDLRFYRSLKSAPAKVAWRILDLRRHNGKDRFGMAVDTWARDRVGVFIKARCPADYKAALAPIEVELVGKKLRRVAYSPMTTRKGALKVEYFFLPERIRSEAGRKGGDVRTPQPVPAPVPASPVPSTCETVLAAFAAWWKAQPHDQRAAWKQLLYREEKIDPGGWAAEKEERLLQAFGYRLIAISGWVPEGEENDRLAVPGGF